MKNKIFTLLAMALCLSTASCVKEKLETTYNSQEDKIEKYIESKRYVKGKVQVPSRDDDGNIIYDDNGEQVMKDSTVTDTLRVINNAGSNRLVTKEGEGEELKENGSIAFYYAGYTFATSFNSSNLFSTNYSLCATEAGWTLSEEESKILTINLQEYDLIPGLKNGLVGVKAGEECEIIFSGKYGFGKRALGIVPANSALAYRIWVESISND